MDKKGTSDYLSAELAATCAELGYYDGSKYHLDQHCMDSMKVLIRYLRSDDDSHTVRRYLGQTNLLQTDLIKIFIEHSAQSELCNILLRLMINLTSPAFIIYNDELPTDKVQRGLYQQVVSHLQGYKVALVNDCIWTAVNNCLSKILNIDSSDRSEENKLTIERILLFIRNVLQIPPDDNEKRTNNDATVHDELLFALHTSGTVDLLLFIASNNSEQLYHLQVLEIIHLMFREQNASQLASVESQRSIIEKEHDEAKLLTIRQKEIEQKIEKVKKYAGSRHSRFGGVYVVQNMKAIGDNQLICHKPYQKIEGLDFSQQKRKIKKPKNKLPMVEKSEERVSALSVRLFLKEFCIEFLNGVYNSVMKNVKFFIDHGNDKSAIDVESCYFWALRFFMEFSRHYKFQVKYVSETISTGIFHLVQKQMECHYEIITGKIDKKDVPLWSRKLHFALKAYKELLCTLMAMDKITDNSVRESSKVIKSNLFYVPEYRDLMLRQLLNYNELRMSRSYLIDLIETVHIFLKMLEQFCGEGRKMVVKKMKVKRCKRQQKSTKEELPSPATLEERWNDVGPNLSAVLRNDIIPEIIPFDDTVDIPDTEQKANAMKKIQKFLRKKLFEEAVGLLRSAREVWPEDDCFGRSDIPVEEEFLALRDIFFADLGVVVEEEEEETEFTEVEHNVGNSFNNEGYDDDDEEEVEKKMSAYEEIDFNVKDFVQKFVNMKVVKACALILQQFESNSVEVNHYVIKLLHRIAWHMKMPAMLFQASIFRIFQRILDSKDPEHVELQKFATFIIRSFTKVAQNNPKSFMELLFWKNTHEATEMVEGYDAEQSNKKVLRTVWSEAEEDELRTLFMEHQTNQYPRDLIDWILENIINQNRTQRAVIKKLKEMCLIVNSKAVKNEIRKRLPKEWSEEEIAQLTEIWYRLKEDEDPVDLIYVELRIKRPKSNIKEKLLELGLAKDQKQLRKKRTRKGNPGKSYDNEADDDDFNTFGKSARSKKSKKQYASISDAKINKLLKDVIEKNMSRALEWILESLEDALEDRDEEYSEGIPLIPLEDYSSAAMDSPSFQRFLRGIGIEPPTDEQEAYWRISSSMLNSTIRKRCDLITAALSGNLDPGEETVQKEESDTDGNSSEDDGNDVFENVKKCMKPRRFELENSSYNDMSFDSSESQLPKKRSNSESGEQNKKKAVDDVRIKDLVDNTKAKINEEQIGTLVKILDPSKMYSDINNESDPKNTTDDSIRHQLESSDIETPLTKKRRIFESDEEDNTEYLVNFKSKCNRKIDSDDED